MIHLFTILQNYNQLDLTAIYKFQFNSIGDLLTTFITPALELASLALLFFTLYGGFKYLTAGGNKEQTAEARAMITHAIIGIILFLLLFLVVEYLTNAFSLSDIIK